MGDSFKKCIFASASDDNTNPVKSNKILDTVKLQINQVIKQRLSESEKIVLVSHLNPDGDAVGSALALHHYLKNSGKSSHVIMPNNYPDFLKWLPGSKEVIIFTRNESEAQYVLSKADFIFLLDFNNPDRAGKVKNLINGGQVFKVMIDHHPNPSEFADIAYCDILSSSTAELVFRFIEMAGNPELVDNVVATCLYTGIMSDTGSFSYNSSQPETYRVLSELLKRGIDKDHIYSMVYDNFSENRLKLLGYCLDRKMVVLPEYKTAYISLTIKEKKQYNYIRGDAEGFVNYPLSIKGIDFVAFLMENDDHVKISFRSKGKFDTNDFAVKNFDGGGHINASGGESKLNLEDTINKFVSLLPHVCVD